MSSLAESLTALPAVVSGPVAFREWADVLQSPDSLSKHNEGHFLVAEENVSLELGHQLNASKGPWNLKASEKDGCQAYLTYHYLWSEMILFVAYHMYLRPLLCILWEDSNVALSLRSADSWMLLAWLYPGQQWNNNEEHQYITRGVWYQKMAHLHDTMILKNNCN